MCIIASTYTEMNAISKGVSLGIYKDGKQKGLEALKGGSQPYVDLMGRRYEFLFEMMYYISIFLFDRMQVHSSLCPIQRCFTTLQTTLSNTQRSLACPS